MAGAPPRILGVFAHPDDEVFCAGGTLAKYVAQGAEAMVLSATRGEAGQIRDAHVATRQTLGQVRERELQLACERLGVQRVVCLDYRDGTLRDVSSKELVGVVLERVRDFDPDVVITFGDDGAYGHPDHIAMSLATTEACATVNDLRGEGGRRPVRLYHSNFPRSRLLLLDRLARWLDELATRFRGNLDFVHALAIFSQETTTLGYASDHVGVGWFPAGSYIIEQGEPAAALYLLLNGEAEVIREQPDGTLEPVAKVGPGEFVGERGLARGELRSAHVVAADNVTCLVFSPDQPLLFAGRGAGATLTGTGVSGGEGQAASDTATTCVDVSAYVDRKVAAVAAYRTQYPIDPSMFPESMLHDMFSKEYFVRVFPPVELESDLLPRS